jgi:hypothetical protein
MAGPFGSWVRFGLPGVVLGMLGTWAWEFHGEPAAAQGTAASVRASSGGATQGRPTQSTAAPATKNVTSGESGGLLALIATPTGAPGQWLYLIDTKKRAFAIYRVEPNNPQGCVKLEASRQFKWDLDLDQYNNQGLEPADVKARVDALNRSNP